MLNPASFKDIISAHIKELKETSARWDVHRNMYRCEQMRATDPAAGDDTSTGDVVTETGSLYAYTDTMVSSVVPPNPQCTLNPYNEMQREGVKFREGLANTTFRRAPLHKVLWSAATMSAVYPRSFVKAVWSHRKARPDFINIDPRHVFYDMSAQQWEDIRYLIEATVITQAEFESRIKMIDVTTGKPVNDPRRQYDPNVASRKSVTAYPSWLRRTAGGIDSRDATLNTFKWVVVYEVWDFTEAVPRYYHCLENVADPLASMAPPYYFLRNPFHMVKFNENLEDSGGLSDASLVEAPIRLLDEVRSLELQHALASIPVPVLNVAGVDNPDKFTTDYQQSSGPRSVLNIEIGNDQKLSDVIGSTPVTALSPSFAAAKASLEQEIMFRLGMPQYTRGVTGTSDVATELALADTALRTRQGKRTTIIDDLVVFATKATIYLYEQFLEANATIPIRVSEGKPHLVTREEMLFRSNDNAIAEMKAGIFPEDRVQIDYDVVPYSPTENSKISQLKRIAEFLPAMQAAPADVISQKRLYKSIANLLNIGDLTPTPEEIAAMQTAQVDAQAAAGGGNNGGGSPAKVNVASPGEGMSGGNMPDGVEEPTSDALPDTAPGGPGAKLPNALRVQ